MDKSKKYKIIINGKTRTGQYELTTLDGCHCFFMDDTDNYEYFTPSQIEIRETQPGGVKVTPETKKLYFKK